MNIDVNRILSTYGGRRFVLTVGAAFISTALLIHGYLTEIVYRDLILATVAAYISANTTQKYFESRNKYKDKHEESNV